MKRQKRILAWMAPLLALALLIYAGNSFTEGSEHKHEGHEHKHKSHAKKAEGSDSKASCSMCKGGKCSKGSDVATVKTAAMMALVKSKTKMIILDARIGKYDDGKRISGAKLVSFKATKSELKKAAGADKNALIITYCGGPTCPLSNKLAGRLMKLGYTNVIEYPEGIPGWIEAGGKVKASKKGSASKEGSTRKEGSGSK